MTQESHASLLYQIEFQQRPLYPGMKRDKMGYFSNNFQHF